MLAHPIIKRHHGHLHTTTPGTPGIPGTPGNADTPSTPGPRIDAVIVPRDKAVIIAVDTIREAGLALGKDIKLISLNETETSRHLKPGITTVVFPTEDIAERAFGRLIERIENRDIPPTRILLPATIIERESTTGG